MKTTNDECGIIDVLKKYYSLTTQIYEASGKTLTHPLNHQWPQNYPRYGGRLYDIMQVLRDNHISVEDVIIGFEKALPETKDQVFNKNDFLFVTGNYNVSHLLIALIYVLGEK